MDIVTKRNHACNLGNNRLNFRVIARASLFAASAFSAWLGIMGSAAAEAKIITVFNHTSDRVTALYVAENFRNDWPESNSLNGRFIPVGGSSPVMLPECELWDVRIFFADGEDEEYYEIPCTLQRLYIERDRVIYK